MKLKVIEGNRRALELEVLKASFLVEDEEEFKAIARRLDPIGKLSVAWSSEGSESGGERRSPPPADGAST